MTEAEADEEIARFASILANPPTIDPAVRDRVNACPDRGNELPVSAYATEGCCSGPTRFECRAGNGRVAGQPTLADCLDCMA